MPPLFCCNLIRKGPSILIIISENNILIGINAYKQLNQIEDMLPDLSEIKKRRKILGITQFKLARLSGVSQSLIAKLESGRLDPTYSNAKNIFLALEKLESSDSKRVKDVMSESLITVDSESLVKDAIKKMKRGNISQLPVFDGKNNVGSISEKTVLDKIEKGENLDRLMEEKIRDLMDGPLPSVNYDMPIKSAASLLQYNQGLIVLRKGRFVGFVAKSDLLK